MRRPLPALEVVACCLGAGTWFLAAACGVVLWTGRDDQGLEGLGTGLVFLMVAFPAAGCAVLTLGTVLVAAVRVRGRLRPLTNVLAVVPSLVGLVVLGMALRPSSSEPLRVQPMPSIAPPPAPIFSGRPMQPLPSPMQVPELTPPPPG